jgi:hypothetical protein
MLFKSRTRLLPALTVLLSLLGLACGGGDPVIQSGEQEASEPPHDVQGALPTADELAAYTNSSFTMCDVKVLGAYWGSLEYDTKETISSKILAGGEPLVGVALDEGRSKALSTGQPTCSIAEMGYTPSDAQAVADNWNYDLSEAKSAMFNKYLNQGKDWLADEVARSRSATGHMTAAEAGEDDDGELPDAGIEAFWDQSDMCEARMLAHIWNQGLYETKVQIGEKLLADMGEAVRSQVNASYFTESAPECSWSDLSYGYDDAQALSKYWGSEVSETKTRMTHKIRSGNREYLNEELQRAQTM